MFHKILIANRGEIAVRIIRACRNMGIRSVAVYSKEDKDSLHVQLADQRICIGEGPARNNYLNMQQIVTAALNIGADAIHPGFGFLSENSDFVRLCEEHGIAFIGPSADVIDSMGNKSHARKTMMEAGVPVVPGTKDPVYDVETGEKLADEIGYPVIVKAALGGGGKGMRVADTPEEFENAFQTAQKEEKRRVAGTPGAKDQRNENHYLFNSGDLLHSICRGRVGSGHKGFLPVISPVDVRWRGNCCRSSVLLLESKGRKPAENQSCIPGVVRHAV